MEAKHIAIALAFALLLGCTQAPGGAPPTGNETNATGPAHTQTEVSGFLQKHLVEYYGLWNIDMPAPEFSGGKWTSDVKVYGDGGSFLVLRAVVDDETMAVSEMWQKIFLNSKPEGIVPIEGTLSCSEGGKLRVYEFANPYCANCIDSERQGEVFRIKFNGSIDYEYRVMLPKTNYLIEAYGYANVSLASKYYICAQKQGKLDGFRKCFVGKYANTTSDEPLGKVDLDICAESSKADMGELAACISTADRDIDTDGKFGASYLGSSATLPSYVVDCKLKVESPDLVKYAICYNYPGTGGC